MKKRSKSRLMLTGTYLVFASALTIVITMNSAIAQESKLPELPKSKRFIDNIEIVVGPSLCFNYGSMFTENYYNDFGNGNFVENKRLSKLGYSVGAGIYHPLNNKIDISARLLWEQKGYRSELNTTLSSAREFRTSDYTYNYLTIPITVKVYLDKKRRISVSLGGYLSQLKGVAAAESFFNTLNFSRTSSSFTGRTIVAFDNDGGINAAAFIPGLQGFAKYDYGLVLGLNYDFRLGDKNRLLLQVIDNFGLTNVNQKNFTVIPSPYERNHSVSILVSYVYQRKPKY